MIIVVVLAKMEKMKSTVTLIVMLTLLSLLGSSSSNITTGAETKVTVTDIITDESATSPLEQNAPTSTMMSMTGLMEETAMTTDHDKLLAGTTFTTRLTKEAENETTTGITPASPLHVVTTKVVVSTDEVESTSLKTPSQTPIVTLEKESTSLPTSAASYVSTERVDISTTVDFSTSLSTGISDVHGDFHTITTENEFQTESTGLSSKLMTSTPSGTVANTSQGQPETTIAPTENGSVSYDPLLTTLLDDATTALPDEDLTTSGGASTTMLQQPPVRSEDIVSPSIIPRKIFSVVLTLSGNCGTVLQDEFGKENFMKTVKQALEEYFKFLKEKYIVMRDVTCGSIIVEFDVEMSEMDKKDFHAEMKDNFTFTYNAHVLQVVDTSIEDYVEDTTTQVVKDDGEPKNSLDFQETLIFIVIGSVGGAFLLVSLFLLCQYLIQKMMRANRKSFSPTDEPCIKLSEFNMAHTYIPRPQSIYSATTRSSFLPYESMEHGLGYSSASPTPYVYADGDQIREHYQEVVDKDQAVTPTTKTINDFGKSGIPNWDLPVLEGVVQEGEGSPTNIEEQKGTRSSTFFVPPDENDIPPPPTSLPPPPPPTVRYHQQGHLGREENSVKSDDGSSHTEQSSGDTRQLIRSDNHDVGVDNPALELDSAYF